MPSLTLKAIPKPLYEELKRSARLHRRSISGEALNCLENALMPRKLDVEEFLGEVRMLQQQASLPRINDRILKEARSKGRP